MIAVLVCSDWEGRDYLGQLGISETELNELGASVKYLPYTDWISTTDIIGRIRA